MQYKKFGFFILLMMFFGIQFSFASDEREVNYISDISYSEDSYSDENYSEDYAPYNVWESLKNILYKSAGEKKISDINQAYNDQLEMIKAATEGAEFALKKEKPPKNNLRFETPPSFYFFLGHTDGKGVANDEGFSSIGSTIFFPYLRKKIFPFLDLRYHMFNDSKFAFNAGVGVRVVPSYGSKIFGLNLYYDYRKTPLHADCYQIGVGGELLSGIMDFRINTYFPIKKWYKIDYCFYSGYIGDYYINRTQYEYVFTGIDAEAGATFFNNEKFRFYGALGTYCLGKNSFFSSFLGAKVRFEIVVRQIFFIDGSITYDDFYKTRGQFQISLRIPIGARSYSRKMISQQVWRNAIIPTERLCRWRWNF